MNLLHEDLARAHSRALLADSAASRQGRELALARKLARRAERNAVRARLHLARLV
jgi:cob(I)alamin adenosyltransferase